MSTSSAIHLLTIIDRVFWPSKNSMKFLFNGKFNFKSTWNNNWIASHQKLPVCQSPAGDTEKLTTAWSKYLERIGLLATGRVVVGYCDVDENIIWMNNVLRTVKIIVQHKLSRYCEDLSYYIKDERVNTIKTTLPNLWQQTIQSSDFSQCSFVLTHVDPMNLAIWVYIHLWD